MDEVDPLTDPPMADPPPDPPMATAEAIQQIRRRLDDPFGVVEWRTIVNRLFGLTLEEAEASGIRRRLRNRSSRSNEVLMALLDVLDLEAPPSCFLATTELDRAPRAMADNIREHIIQQASVTDVEERVTTAKESLAWCRFDETEGAWGSYRQQVEANTRAGLTTGVRVFCAADKSTVTNFVTFPPDSTRDATGPWIVVLRLPHGKELNGYVTGAHIRKNLQRRTPRATQTTEDHDEELKAAGDPTGYSPYDGKVVTRITSFHQLRRVQRKLFGDLPEGMTLDIRAVAKELQSQAALLSTIVPLVAAVHEARLLKMLERIDVGVLQHLPTLKQVDNMLQSTTYVIGCVYLH